MPPQRREALERALAHAPRDEADQIFGPDMDTDETCMAWINDEIGRAAIQGFDAVGKLAARFPGARAAKLVAASDSRGVIADEKGIDVAALIGPKEGGRTDYPSGRPLERDAVIDIECDIWIPAPRPDVIDDDVVIGRLRTTLVPEGANIPLTPGAEDALHAGGVLVMRDFIANAGVICAALEYAGATQSQAFQAIEERIRATTAARRRGCPGHGTRPGGRDDAAIQHHVISSRSGGMRTDAAHLTICAVANPGRTTGSGTSCIAPSPRIP